MYQGSCSIVTEGLTYCPYLSQLIETWTSYSSIMNVHLQFLVDDDTRSMTFVSKTIPGKCCNSARLSIFASCILLPIQMYCVLLGFSFKRFDDIQSLISVMVLTSSVRACIASLALQCRYACVSSAYCWTPAPALPATSSTSAVKRTYKSGPSTDPCGTPVPMTRHSKRRLPIWTDWVRSRTNDSSQSNARLLIP